MLQRKLEQLPWYRWCIFAVCILWELVLSSLTLPDSVYVVPVTAALGFSRTQFTLVFSIRSMVQLAGSLCYGKLYQKYGTKPLMILGVGLLALGYFLYAGASSLWVFYLSAVAEGIATSLISASAMTIILGTWFDRSAGLIFGVIYAGSSIGGAALSSLAGKAIAAFGYSRSYFYTGVLAIVSALPILIFAFERSSAAQASSAEKAPVMTLRRFLGDRMVRCALALCFAVGLTIYPMEASISAHMTDRGFAPEFGANMLGAALLISAAGKILHGVIYDRCGIRAAACAGMGCFAVGAALFIGVRGTWQAYLFVAVFGLSIANIMNFAPFLAKSLLRAEEYGTYIGFFSAVVAAGNTVGFALMNACFDRLHTYTPYVIAQILLAVAATAVFCRMHHKWERAKRKESV